MLDDLEKHRGEVALEQTDLNQPISTTVDGAIATVRDMIADIGADRVRKMFGVKPETVHVCLVGKLDRQALRLVAKETFLNVGEGYRVASIGTSVYNRQQLVDEIERGTETGELIVDAVRLHSLVVEDAIVHGTVQWKSPDREQGPKF